MDKVLRHDKGQKVVYFMYDSHMSAAVCPDHLFKGLITDVLTVCFKFLPNDCDGRYRETIVCTNIMEHGLPVVDSVL